LAYQWINKTTSTAVGSASNFVYTAVSGSNSFYCKVSNTFGSATSSVVTVIGQPFVAPASGGFTLNVAVAPNSTAANVYSGQGAYNDPGNNVWNAFGSSGAVTPLVTSASNSTLVTATLIFGFNNGSSTGVTNGTPDWLVSFEDAVNGGSPGVGTADAPMGQLTLNNVPQGYYKLYLYGQNYDGNRGSVFAVAPANGGVPDNGMTATTNTMPAATPATLVEGDNYVFFHAVKPDPSGTITVTYIPNPFGTLTGEAPLNAAQLVGMVIHITPATPGNVTVSWWGGSLVSASQVQGPYTPMAGSSPLTLPATGSEQFFRVQQ
jgi:hypothetical protein